MKIKEIQHHEVKGESLVTIIYHDGSIKTIPKKDMYGFEGILEFYKEKSKKPLKETIMLDGLEDYLKGEKESNGKLSYELHRPFITAMAKRMSQNKGKYPPYNRQKPMDIEELKQALFRHTIEVMKGNYTDIEDYDHLSAIACNAQFIYYQLKNHESTVIS